MQKRKGRIMWIALIIIAIVFAGIMYWVNGRTIYDAHTPATGKELDTIHEIMAYEQQKIDECTALLAKFTDQAQSIGLELKPVLNQHRAVNYDGKVETHDFNMDMWLPKYYSSRIMIWVYKDGEPLVNKTSSSTTSFFVSFYTLVDVRKNEGMVEYTQDPFNNHYTDFDANIEDLIERASVYVME